MIENFTSLITSFTPQVTIDRIKEYSKIAVIGASILGATAAATYAPFCYFAITALSIGYSAHRAVVSIYEAKDALTIQKAIGISLVIFGV